MSETINTRERQLHLPFDQHQRYKLVTESLERLRGGNGSTLQVLDVGGAEGTILNFLDKDEVTILDQAAVEGMPGFVQGDATALPFEDGAFDYVTSVDTYEHIAPEARERYLSELRRVARKGVLLAAPFEGSGVREAEQLASEFWRTLYGQEQFWLHEHEEYGLPELNETRTFYEELGDSVAVLPNGYLPNWLAMICMTFYSMQLRGKQSQVAQTVNQFYNQFLYEHDNAEPCYRYLVVALKEPAPVELGGDSAPRPSDPERANLAFALLSSLTSSITMWTELRKLNVELAQKEARIQDLTRRLAHQIDRTNAHRNAQRELGQTNRRLGRQLEDMRNSRSWRLVTLLYKLRRLGR